MRYEQDSSLILIVEDNSLLRGLLREAMELEGYQVIEAANGEEGIAAYSTYHPDLVLLDALMPIMDGFTCCNRLQNLPGGDRTPILMITALEDAESVNRAFDMGATDFVTKPIHWAVLRQRVRRWLHQSQIHKQLEATNLELQRLVCLDSLTQVASRHYFNETLEHEIRRTLRDQTPLSLILCDVDYFKLYNDTYGHQQGDWCLQHIAKALQRAVQRPGDLVARYGGEEFAAILPQTDAQGAIRVAQKIRQQIQNIKIEHLTSPVSQYVTVSLGIACTVPGEVISSAKLIKAADLGLYRAKNLGRDRLAM